MVVQQLKEALVRTRILVPITVAAIVLPLLAATLPGEKTPLVSPAFEIRVVVAPSSTDQYQLLKRKTPETYSCSAMVAAPDTVYTYATANLVASPGKKESVTRRFSDEYELKFTVTVDARNLHAKTVTEISREGVVLTRQSSTFVLRHDNKSDVVPVE